MALKVMNGLDLVSQRIVNLADPSASTDAVTKQYVDNYVQGLAFKDEVAVATTANGTLATAFANGQSVDGYVLVTGDRILIKNQATATENGIYVVTAGAPTRASDADSGSELKQATVRVVNGTTNGNTQWTCNNTGTITLGSTLLTFVASGAGTSVAAGNGLTGTSSLSVLPNGTSIDISASGVKIADAAGGAGLTVASGILAVGQGNGISVAADAVAVLANGTSIDVSPSGIKIADAAGGNGLTVSSGVLAVGAGTGISVTADAVGIDTGVVVRKYAAAIGNGALTTIAVTHNLGTRDITFSIYNASTYEVVMADAVITDTNTLTLTFATAPASGAYRVVVHG